ncbi:adenosine deaminase [Jatrophihabitans sp. GAS493]|uniref:adenosine deaminase n=1 Tax=Jatrophihabitans sp. GAS493 TaxID=1907575 RepID=UPI000BB6C444|nr:adenosine deaminase [Jatrophihabitans sp. GAS493]SOD71971.1 adenosine deaminase [Jatrophihabitans sp. GAS493]
MNVNLHSHLEGRIRPATAAELSEGSVADWAQALRLDGPADLTVYLEKVAASYPFFDTGEHIFRIAKEAVLDAATDGQAYLELRFGPATHVRPGFAMADVVAAACAGVREGSRMSGMPAGLVVAVLRSPRHRESLLDVARAAAAHAGAGVVGFDLAGDELRFPDLEPYVEAFALARSAGLGLTCHAAEAAPARYARQAVELLGATRIGHGAHVAGDREVLAWIRDQGVVIECCPTSNWYTGAIAEVSEHPARIFRERGLAIVLGDDNPMQTGSTLRDEREVLQRSLGFDSTDLQLLDETSIGAAFLENSVRAGLRAMLLSG